MKNYVVSKMKFFTTSIFLIIMITSCTKNRLADEVGIDPIVGKWFLITVDNTDVSTMDCFPDSFIESDAETITFFLKNRLENGDCETVSNVTDQLIIKDSGYFVGQESIEFNINGNTLTWIIDTETTFIFKK